MHGLYAQDEVKHWLHLILLILNNIWFSYKLFAVAVLKELEREFTSSFGCEDPIRRVPRL